MDNPLPDELRVIVEDLQRYLVWEGEQGKVSILSRASAPPALVKPATDRSLEAIRQELGDCKRCKLSNGRTQIVFGVGNPKAELVFVGEGPGAEEDAQGVPFVGAAGQLLTKMIEAMGLRRADVYICNVVKCRPPGNRDPEPEEIEACEPFLKAQLAAIQPRGVRALLEGPACGDSASSHRRARTLRGADAPPR